MRKLELRALDLGATEVLTRTELKTLLGGSDPGGGDTCQNACGGSTGGTCEQGYQCASKECPDNKELMHTYCKQSG